MKFIVRITSEEYEKFIKQSHAKCPADVKKFIKNEFNVNHDFELRVHNADAYEFVAEPEEKAGNSE